MWSCCARSRRSTGWRGSASATRRPRARSSPRSARSGAPSTSRPPAQEAALASLGAGPRSNGAGATTPRGGCSWSGVARARFRARRARPWRTSSSPRSGRTSRPLFEQLLREGVIVRPTGGLRRPGAIRVTVGTPEENEIFAEALGRVWRRAAPGIAVTARPSSGRLEPRPAAPRASASSSSPRSAPASEPGSPSSR